MLKSHKASLVFMCNNSKLDISAWKQGWYHVCYVIITNERVSSMIRIDHMLDVEIASRPNCTGGLKALIWLKCERSIAWQTNGWNIPTIYGKYIDEKYHLISTPGYI